MAPDTHSKGQWPRAASPSGGRSLSQCALCGQLRAVGSVVEPDNTRAALWICGDCQNKLNRSVDDEGVQAG